MSDDDWSELASSVSTSAKEPKQFIKNAHQIPSVSTPFTNIVRIEAYFQQIVKAQGAEEPQKITKLQQGNGFLIAKNKVFTSASLLYSNETKSQANYVLLFPESSEIQTKKGIKSKYLHINENYKFQEPFQKFNNNFGIIFVEQSLIPSSVWQPFEFDWTFDEDHEAKENTMIAGYRWRDSDKVYEKVFKQFKPEERQNGVLKSGSKLIKGQEGSPLIIREKDAKDPTKIIYKVIGILTKSSSNKAYAIEFGYLFEDKQINKKQMKTLGVEVLFSIEASKSYQDLKKQDQATKSQLKNSKVKKAQQPKEQIPSDPANDVSQTMKSSLAEKISRIKNLESQVQQYQIELSVMKNQSSLNLIEAEEVSLLNAIILTFKKENESLNKKISQMMVKEENLLEENRKIPLLKERQAQLMSENQLLKAQIAAKDSELTEKAIAILNFEEKLNNQIRPPTVLQSSSSVSQIQQPSSQSSSQVHQPSQSSSVVNRIPSNQSSDISEEFTYLMLAFDNFEECTKRYQKNVLQLIQSVQNQYSVTLTQQGYSLDHRKMLFYAENFISHEWNNLEYLDLSESGISNSAWEKLSQYGYMMPKLKVLILKDNELGRIIPEQLDFFGSLKILILERKKFTTLQTSMLESYERSRGDGLKIILK